ncbi:MAG: UDP-N-acetylenolpyruvoylglucosamine reductase [Bacteroidetes bacterium]|nr:MAG: UDP-N-acetylenolpyruvoylglucosamine reductase [Bacteroidota bacterium]
MFQKNISLKPYNTFGVKAYADSFVSVTSIDLLQKIVAKHKDLFVLSGGSNVLITKNIRQPVLHLNIQGKSIRKNKEENIVFVKAMAGENWHEFVLWTLENNFGGLENLSLIPGNVGTSPMQNIGAYGIEIKDVFHKLEALEIESGKLKTFYKDDCNFGYRESVFKNILKCKYIIVSVTFQLTKNIHKLNTSYGAIQTELEKNNIKKPSIKDVSNAIIAIRESKLPDPKEIGNSGSFFKNPVVSIDQFKYLEKEYPNMPYYKVSDKTIKIPAGWLIEQCGFKGKRFGNAGVHKDQALVLVNYGNATGNEILDLANNILKTVSNKFGIDLEIEVNII